MDNSSAHEEQEIRKTKRIGYVVIGIFAALAMLFLIWFGAYRYRHTFTAEKWQNDPGRRYDMTDDLLRDHALVGMTEDEVVALLGQNDNDRGYFNQDKRFVYCLGDVSFSIDRAWLLIDFENGAVKGYSFTVD